MISPRVTSFSRLELRENAPGDREGGVRRGPSGVEGEVGDRLDELLLRDAVLQCALEVERQFIRAVACDECGDRDQTAVARRQAGPPPDVAPPDLQDRLSCDLHENENRGKDEHLAEGMRVPGTTGARLECDDCTAEASRRGCGDEVIDADAAREEFCGTVAGRLRAAALNFHR